MESLDSGTVIAVCALMTVLFGIIQLSLWPIRKSIDKLEVGQAKLEVGQAKLNEKLDKLLAKQ